MHYISKSLNKKLIMPQLSWRHLDYSDPFYWAIIDYLQTGQKLPDLPFHNFRHKWVWWQRVKSRKYYKLRDKDLYYVDIDSKPPKEYKVIAKSQIQPFLQEYYYNLETGLRAVILYLKKYN